MCSASCETVGAGQMTEFKQSEKLFIWRIKKIEGGSEVLCRVKVNDIHVVYDHHTMPKHTLHHPQWLCH